MFDFSDLEDGDFEKFALFDYAPVQEHQQQLIQGPGGPTMGAAERRLQIANALLGEKKQVRMYILIYKNQPLEASLKQEGYWMGGNKNEFTLTIGVDDRQRVTWSRVISWTDEKSLEIDLREYIGVNFVNTGERLDLIPIVNWMAKNVELRWQRKQFAEFDYITVEPPWHWVLITFLVVTLVNVGSSAWSVLNQFVGEEGSYRAAGRRILHPKLQLPRRFGHSIDDDILFDED